MLKQRRRPLLSSSRQHLLCDLNRLLTVCVDLSKTCSLLDQMASSHAHTHTLQIYQISDELSPTAAAEKTQQSFCAVG